MEPSVLNTLTKTSALSLAEQELFYKQTVGVNTVMSATFLLSEDRHAILNVEVPASVEEKEDRKKKDKGKKKTLTWLAMF